MRDLSVDVLFEQDIEKLKECLPIGERIGIGIPAGKITRWNNVTVIEHYPHHFLARTESGSLESFRWLDLLTVYSWRYLM